MPRILITGANGFVGTAASRSLAASGHTVRVAIRQQRQRSDCREALELKVSEIEKSIIGDVGPETDWSSALRDIDVIVHLAGRAHVMHEFSSEPIDEFRLVNVAGTLNLARHAVRNGVRRFIFMSSIKVNGGYTTPARPYRADDTPAPLDAYGVSKYEAEEGLRRLAAETGLEVAIIRSVLVYGAGVKGNFLSMMRWLHKGIPLPLGAIDNRRSFVSLDNLVHLIATCLQHPAAANQTFLVSDGEDLSTRNLLHRLAGALGRPAHLLSVPVTLLKGGGLLLGKSQQIRRLCDSLQVDISKTRALLGWSPPGSVDEGLHAAAQGFLQGMDR